MKEVVKMCKMLTVSCFYDADNFEIGLAKVKTNCRSDHINKKGNKVRQDN